MCSPHYASQASCNLDKYLPSKLSSEDELVYQSCEELIRSFKPHILSSVYQVESDMFNATIDDQEALLALEDDDLFSVENMDSDPDDTIPYFSEQSTVIPHIPNLSNESQVQVAFPSSPSSMTIFEYQKSKTSSPNSPVYLDRSCGREFHVYDRSTDRQRRPYLHEFIRLILENDEYSDIIQFTDRKQGIFKIEKPYAVAELWKYAKGRVSRKIMTYDKLARALRYYYISGIMRPAPGRYTFQLGPKTGFGITWSPIY